ncbi:MAG: hypothetical protein Q8S20_22070 [Sulfuritalea sp.]|nr:hypothetical protein [Sulfuritalea sp.]
MNIAADRSDRQRQHRVEVGGQDRTWRKLGISANQFRELSRPGGKMPVDWIAVVLKRFRRSRLACLADGVADNPIYRILSDICVQCPQGCLILGGAGLLDYCGVKITHCLRIALLDLRSYQVEHGVDAGNTAIRIP